MGGGRRGKEEAVRCWDVELGNGSPYTGGSTGAERPDLDERRAERALTVTPICVQKPIF